MLRSLLFATVFMLLASCAQPLPGSSAETTATQQGEAYHAQYDRTALQSMKWLNGAWKGHEAGIEITQTFAFHPDNSLEVTITEAGSPKAVQFFSWKDGHYFYGQNRQWVVTWISEKNIRFEPLTPGLKPMTWSKVEANKWHLLRHTDQGDEVTVMERTDEISS